jgi:prepilin signal peptidase PulO-like enzyme (type II secretory pathway)
LRFEKLIAYAGVRESLREILFGLMLGAMVNLHVYDFPCEEPASWMKSRATWFV